MVIGPSHYAVHALSAEAPIHRGQLGGVAIGGTACCAQGALRFQQRARMRRAVNFRENFGLVDFYISFREPMLVECLRRTPTLNQDEYFRVAL